MNRVKKLALAALFALTLATGATYHRAGDPSQLGVYKKGSFDITEVEGVAKKGSFDITEVEGVAWSWGETQTGTGDGGGRSG